MTKFKKKPALEKVQPSMGHSFTVKKFSSEEPNGTPIWHFHPEIELVFIQDGSGKRHIGNHFSYYKNGDLLLIGPNLPHYGFTDRLTKSNREIVVQFSPDFLGDQFFDTEELKNIRLLFEKSKQGLRFRNATRERVGNLLNQMVLESNFDKLMHLLLILNELANSDDYEYLNASGISLEIETLDNDRINRIFDYVRNNFQKSIPLELVSSEVNMTVPSFCRFFKMQTNQTFTQFVNQFRVVHACKLLAEEHITIAEICFECGYNNLSHFNKHFKKITGKSPSIYRKQFKKVIQ